MKTKSFKELIVWQKAKELALAVYELTAKFPKSELFGLTNQMRRSAISISLLIKNEKKKEQTYY